MREPTIIAFEGIDGSGKTVQTELLIDRLEELGYSVNFWSFPNYEGFFGEEIASMLTGASTRADEVDPKSMALWYAMDRYETLIYADPDFFKSDFIICNRYTLSNVAFQSARDATIADWIFELEHEELELPQPTLYIIFDITVQASEKNIGEKGPRDYTEGADIYESSSGFQDWVRNRYLELAEEYDNIKVISIMDGDKLKSKDAIHGEVMELLYNTGILERYR